MKAILLDIMQSMGSISPFSAKFKH